jgi:uncharacterized protein YndB with AHSA1/START domain
MEKFVYVSYIATTPEKLWEALTSDEFVKSYWSGRTFRTDWKPGSPLTLVMEDGKTDWDGKVLRYEPFSILSYSFHFVWMPELAKEPESRVIYELEPKGNIVKLTVTHDELTERVYRDVSRGWPGILSALKTLLETGKTFSNH